ncbi:helix-turn-helix domain-containing protein [Halomarina salina]|uniref:Helix-turn-helix domain-containing protein n=1 Tax=Halomarina salina TaxID=1872699 RepID=A0ABD5RLD7_9EURY|nr:helix-turn-helix domain-containing protein [Halomarina salina]
MSVVAELSIQSKQFELGRVLELSEGMLLELDRVVPVGESTVPLVWVYASDTQGFEERVANHPSVRGFEALDRFSGRALYRLDWDTTGDHLFDAIHRERAHVLRATATPESWTFELRFPSHEALSGFQTHCENARIHFSVARIGRSNEPDDDPRYGLTESQYDALVLAVESGYYDIPRRRTTVELAEELGISDQAVTERLRRAIIALTENTLDGTGHTK